MIILTAALSIQTRATPAGQAAESDCAHEEFRDDASISSS
jgi:hypothetical protein